MSFADPSRAYPIRLPDGTAHPGTVFLSQVIDHPRWEVGDYTYASDFDPPADWARHLAPYLWPNQPERLRIGRYCQITHGVRFITSSANHAMDGLTTFPFPVFDPAQIASYHPDVRDTIVGHDVWLGYGAMICPGAKIGTGAVVGAGAVVRGAVPDYAIVTGNPAQIVRMRFDAATVSRLLELAWWTWPAADVTAAIPALLSGDVERLEKLAP